MTAIIPLLLRGDVWQQHICAFDSEELIHQNDILHLLTMGRGRNRFDEFLIIPSIAQPPADRSAYDGFPFGLIDIHARNVVKSTNTLAIIIFRRDCDLGG